MSQRLCIIEFLFSIFSAYLLYILYFPTLPAQYSPSACLPSVDYDVNILWLTTMKLCVMYVIIMFLLNYWYDRRVSFDFIHYVLLITTYNYYILRNYYLICHDIDVYGYILMLSISSFVLYLIH
jgi:hypothetical protein